MTDSGIMVRWMQYRTWDAQVGCTLGGAFLKGWTMYKDAGIASRPIPPTPYLKLTTDELTQANQIKTQLDTYVNENFAVYVNGQKSFDTWQSDFISGLNGMQLSQYLAIYNGAYARYKASH
jgi:hypothetical protein